MSYSSQDDFDKIYCYPGTHVLINKLGIKTAELLSEAERRISSARISDFKGCELKQPLNIDTLKTIHKHIFGDIYEWAGDYRSVRISKGFTFAYPEHIKEQCQMIFKQLAKDKLKGLNKEQLSEKLSHYKTELNVIHPFRDGNGRSIRAFTEMLAEENGYALNFSKIDPSLYHRAMVESPNNNSLLSKVIYDALEYQSAKLELTQIYKTECPAISFISEQSAEKIMNLNQQNKDPLSISEIKNLYLKCGKKFETSPTPENQAEYLSLKNIIDDLKQAQIKYKESVSIQKTSELELLR